MRHALALGRRGLGRVAPNPAVGCVIVKDGRILGRARTADGGRPHAETRALEMAGAAAQGATAYVTLEPCAHHGRTSPCTDALIRAGIARVVIAAPDPNPQVNGQGVVRLRAAGIEVTTDICRTEAEDDQRGFLLTMTDARPMVTLKLAATLDGRIATATGESRWITGPEARRMVHAMRQSHDAVLIGAGTARADDPTLTVRDLGADRQPVRIVASRHLNLPWPNRLAASIGEGPVWVAHGAGIESAEANRWTETGAQLVPVAVSGSQLDPTNLLQTLAARGLTRIFCEGGGALAASLIAAGLVDDLVVFHAGLTIGAEGQPAVGVLGLASLAEAQRFERVETRIIGNDVMTRWRKPISLA